MSQNGKLKAGIIGMGKMGRIRLKETEAHEAFEIVALTDVNSDVAREFPQYKFCEDWKQVLDQDLDVVFVCTYNQFIPEITCEALGRGLHVFSEKPPGRTVQDIEQMRTAEEKAGDRVLKFGFNHRFHYAVMEAKAMIESGKYGKILWARGTYGKAGGNSFANNWRSNPEHAGGGILLDQGIHMLDLLLYFMGGFSEAKSFVENAYWKDVPMEDNAFALLKSDEGQVAMVHSSATQWRHKFNLDLYLEDGYVCLNGILSSTRSYGDESITFARKQFEGEATAFGKPREETIYFDRDDSWKLELQDFYDCIVGKKERPTGSSEDAYKVMRLVYDIYDAVGK